MADILSDLEKGFREAGFLYRAVGLEIIQNLEETFAMLLERELISEALHAEYAESVRYVPPTELGATRSLVVVAAPSPAVKVLFHLDTGPLEAIIPPTYMYSAIRGRCQAILENVLAPAGSKVARASVPAKLLAVRAGLAEYGRNNIAYVRGMGSFCRLEVFVTDADLVPPGQPRAGLSPYLAGGREPRTGHWSPPRRMGRCAACKACHHACPTDCIPFPDEGVIIEAKRCLTYLNENESEWPGWLDTTAHNCLVGCMQCQMVCPGNEYHIRREEVVADFDREEAALILRNLPSEELPASLRVKLGLLDLEEYSTVLGRNLLALAG